MTHILEQPVSIAWSTEPVFTRPKLLLHPPIPTSLRGVNPRTIEGKEWWDAMRKKVYLGNNHCCFACGVYQLDAKIHPWLEAHECYDYDFDALTISFREVVALCPSCHSFIYWPGLRAYRPDVGRKVLRRGIDVLMPGGLGLPKPQWWLATKLYPQDFPDLVKMNDESFKEIVTVLCREQWTLKYKGESYDQASPCFRN